MRKAIAYWTLSLVALSVASSQADKTVITTDQVAMAYVPGNPLMQLPGMSPVTPHTFSTAPSLPAPIITDVSNAPNPFDSRKGGAEGQTLILYTLSKDLARPRDTL